MTAPAPLTPTAAPGPTRGEETETVSRFNPYHFLIAASAIAIASAGGCVDDRRDQAADYLPPPASAANVVDLGHGWRMFELTAGGRTRRFLQHAYGQARTNAGLRESLVELREEPPAP